MLAPHYVDKECRGSCGESNRVLTLFELDAHSGCLLFVSQRDPSFSLVSLSWGYFTELTTAFKRI